MRRASLAAIVVVLISGRALFAAQITEVPFVPLSPTVMAAGGSAIATAQGFDSFFYNPAGLSRGGSELMLTSVTSWISARPDQLFSQAARLAAGTADPAATFNFISSQVTTGGFGGGMSYGLGYIRNGLGIGMALILDSLLYGQTLLGMTGDLTATLGFIGGLSIPFDFLGMKVNVGGDVRPMIRIHAPITNSNAVSLVNALARGGDLAGALNSGAAYYGSGFALDLGAIAELGWFSFGVSIRDLGGTFFRYTSNRFGTVTGSLASHGALPAGSPASDSYVIPMDVGAGISIHPDLGNVRYFVDPRLSADFRNIIGALDGSAVVWTLLHAGVEVKLLNMFTLSGGINQGYFTLGGGVKLVAVDMNAAIFTRELGAHLGDRPSSGMTFNVEFQI